MATDLGDPGGVVTPFLALDRARLERNAARMRAAVARHGVRLRPHVKTAKSAEVAGIALGDAPFRGITVSTLAEARFFGERGFGDRTYAVAITPGKLDAVAALGTVSILTDEPTVARAIAAHPARFSVWLEIDAGQHRGGVAPDDPSLLEAARILDAAPRATLAGVLTHAGHSYGVRGPEAIAAVAEQERAAAVEAATRIRGLGIACPEVSVGSTPTALFAARLDGVTEVRAGVYVFFDLFQHAIGVCARDELALSVVASVIHRRRDALWIDAGTLAMSSERSLDGVGGSGYGEVTALDGSPIEGAPRVVALNQEHGKVVCTDGSAGRPALEVGDRVRVWPNHACITAAMFDRYHVVEGERMIAEWPRLPT